MCVDLSPLPLSIGAKDSVDLSLSSQVVSRGQKNNVVGDTRSRDLGKKQRAGSSGVREFLGESMKILG